MQHITTLVLEIRRVATIVNQVKGLAIIHLVASGSHYDASVSIREHNLVIGRPLPDAG